MEKIKNLSVKGGFSLDGSRITATTAELNALAGQGVVAADAAKLHAITASAAEINALTSQGVVAADAAKLHAITASAAEINALTGQGVVAADAAKLHAITTTAERINNAGQAIGTVACDRTVKIAAVTLSGGAINTEVTNWQNPESSKILILRAIADITTKSTAASTLDIGLTETSATTASDTLLDGIDTGTAAALWDSTNDSDNGTNGVANVQALAAGKWVTFKEASGNTAAMVGTVYIQYIPA